MKANNTKPLKNEGIHISTSNYQIPWHPLMSTLFGEQYAALLLINTQGEIWAANSRFYESYGAVKEFKGSQQLATLFGHKFSERVLEGVKAQKSFRLTEDITIGDVDFFSDCVHVDVLENQENDTGFFLITFLTKHVDLPNYESINKYENLFRNSPMGIFTYNRKGQILDANQALVDLLDSPSLESTLKINVLDFPLLVESGISDDLRKVLKENCTVENVRHYTSKWGKSMFVKYHAQPVVYEGGKVQIIQVLIEDFSEREQAQLELEEAKEEAETAHQKEAALLRAIPDMMFVFSWKGEIVDFHVQQQELLYTNPDFFLGKHVSEILPPDVANLTREKISRVLQTKQIEVYDYTLSLKGDVHVFESRMVWVSPQKTLAIVRDVTEQRTAQKKLVEAKRKAEESDRLKSSFLANMSHEIRTPMNSILGFASLLKDSHKITGQLENYADIIHTSSNRLLRIINDILDISKLETGQQKIYLERCNVFELMDSLYTKYSPQVQQKGLTLKLRLEKSSWSGILITDETRLNQVFVNLLDNALKFTKHGGLEFGAIHKPTEVLFYVLDTGIGISQEHHQQIFSQFGQASDSTARDYGGTGLGLSICKGLVSLLGGEIWVESEEGKGATFYFTLPHS